MPDYAKLLEGHTLNFGDDQDTFQAAQGNSDTLEKDLAEILAVRNKVKIAEARLLDLMAKGENVEHRFAELEHLDKRIGTIIAALTASGRIDINSIEAAEASVESELKFDEVSEDEEETDEQFRNYTAEQRVLRGQLRALDNPPSVLIGLEGERKNAVIDVLIGQSDNYKHAAKIAGIDPEELLRQVADTRNALGLPQVIPSHLGRILEGFERLLQATGHS